MRLDECDIPWEVLKLLNSCREEKRCGAREARIIYKLVKKRAYSVFDVGKSPFAMRMISRLCMYGNVGVAVLSAWSCRGGLYEHACGRYGRNTKSFFYVFL